MGVWQPIVNRPSQGNVPSGGRLSYHNRDAVEMYVHRSFESGEEGERCYLDVLLYLLLMIVLA